MSSNAPEPTRARSGRYTVPAVAALALLATLLANLAWLGGLHAVPAGARLSGLHTLNSEDTPTYYAWIDQARRGNLRFRQLYTTEPHEPALVNPLFLAVGALAAFTGLSNAAAYHVARVLLGLVLVPACYAFLSACLPGLRRRLIALAILLFAGGVGWIWRAAGAAPGAWPIDLWVPEASVFLSLVESPLNLASYALWASLSLAALRGLARGGVGSLLACGAAAALLVAIRPYAAAPAAGLAVVGCALAAARSRATWGRAAGVAAALGIGVGVGVVPALLTLGASPVFAAWRAASTAAPPPLVALAAGVAWPLGLAVFGLRSFWMRGGPAGSWVCAWIVVLLALVYVPIGPQVAFSRKLLEGLPLPLAVLAGEGAVRLLTLLPSAALRAAALLAGLALAFASNAAVLRADARAFAGGAYPYRLPACLVRGLDELRAQSTQEEVVLAPRLYGLMVPARSGNTVVCCHRDQTVDAARKAAEVDAFYARGDAPRAELLERYGVDWVVYGPGQVPPRDLAERLERRAVTACLRLYRVRSP
jgi:hypothetical protein